MRDRNGLRFDADDGWRETRVENEGTETWACSCTCAACGVLAEVYDDDDHEHYWDEDDNLESCDGHWNPVCSQECLSNMKILKEFPSLAVGKGM